MREETDNRVEQALDLLKERYPDADVVLSNIVKGNDLKLTGISIREHGKEVSITPNIYIDKMLNDPNMTAEDIADHVAEVHEEEKDMAVPEGIARGVEAGRIVDWDYVKNKIQMRVCDPSRNEEFLKGKPHRSWGPLEVNYYVDIGNSGDGSRMSMSVTDQLMRAWHVTPEEMDNQAAKNTREQVTVRILTDMLHDMMPDVELPPLTDDILVMSTLGNQWGASGVVAAPELLDRVQIKFGAPVGILPSSVHEVLLVAVKSDEDIPQYAAMVQAVNGAEVAPADRLWDGMILYDQGRIQAIPSTPTMERANELVEEFEIEM